MTQTTIYSADSYLSFADLCNSTNISPEYIIDLVEYDIIAPIAGAQPQEWQFTITAVTLVNKAARLHRDLEIDWDDIALVLHLLGEIEQLKNENSQLKQQLKRFLM